MRVVYRTQNTRVGRFVAIKLVEDRSTDNVHSIERLIWHPRSSRSPDRFADGLCPWLVVR